jgi:hypothetical protein
VDSATGLPSWVMIVSLKVTVGEHVPVDAPIAFSDRLRLLYLRLVEDVLMSVGSVMGVVTDAWRKSPSWHIPVSGAERLCKRGKVVLRNRKKLSSCIWALCFSGEALSDCGGVGSQVAGGNSGMESALKREIKLDLEGDSGGVKH